MKHKKQKGFTYKIYVMLKYLKLNITRHILVPLVLKSFE